MKWSKSCMNVNVTISLLLTDNVSMPYVICMSMYICMYICIHDIHICTHIRVYKCHYIQVYATTCMCEQPHVHVSNYAYM